MAFVKLKTGSNIRGVGFILLAIFIFSLQNIAVKRIGGDYPVLEIVTFRSLIAIPLTFLFFRLEKKRRFPATRRRGLHLFRGLCFFLSYITSVTKTYPENNLKYSLYPASDTRLQISGKKFLLLLVLYLFFSTDKPYQTLYFIFVGSAFVVSQNRFK